MKTSTRSVLALSAALLIGLPAAALGAPHFDGEVASKTVRFKDLDLSTAAGAQTLYERIAAAARFVCRGEHYTLARECRVRAVADAVGGVGSPLLSSIHRSTIERVEEVVRR
jgi:UrcA family protein